MSSGLKYRKFVFSGEPAPLGLLYNTWGQRVALFEGDSAEVLDRLLPNLSDTNEEALRYIIENGTFSATNPRPEAESTLRAFIESLDKAGLLLTQAQAISAGMAYRGGRVQEIVDPTLNPELRISNLMSESHHLYSLTLEVTYECNERCIHCYCPDARKTKELSIDEIERLLAEFRELGGFRLQLTGGEFFLRKDANRILHAAKKQGLLVDIITNLTMMSEEHLEAIVELAPREVGCSVYSADPGLHDDVTGLPGSFERTIKSVKKLRSRGIPVLLKSPLMRHTIHGWKDLKKLSESLDCGWQCDLSITPRNDGGQSPVDLRATDEKILKELFSSVLYSIAAKDEPAAAWKGASPEAVLCGAGANGLTISPDGTIRPCIGLMHSLGHYPKNSLRDVWSDTDWFEAWSKKRLCDIEQCRECNSVGFCSRCPGAWELETGSVMIPPQFTCFLANTWRESQHSS